jgi:hypothetical protein
MHGVAALFAQLLWCYAFEMELHLEGGSGDKTRSRTGGAAAAAERGRRSSGAWVVFGDPRYVGTWDDRERKRTVKNQTVCAGAWRVGQR